MIVLEERYTYERISREMEKLVQQFGEILSYKVIGYSHDEREIRMMRLGLGEKVLFCTAGVHGRESINPIILLKMIEEYARAYTERAMLAGCYDMRQILQQYSILWIPVVNPDGYCIAMEGFEVIRNPKLRQSRPLFALRRAGRYQDVCRGRNLSLC